MKPSQSTGWSLWTVLVLAVVGTVLLVASMLLGLVLTPNPERRNRQLCEAVVRRDIGSVEKYLANGVSPKCRCRATSGPIEDDWTTLLHKAVGDPQLMRLILQHGVDVNTRNSDGETALFDVVSLSDGSIESDCAMLLIEAGIDVNAREIEYGTTAVHKAASSDSVECLRLLLEHGGDPNLRDRHGHTPMHVAGSVLKGLRDQTVQLLLDYGADPTIKDNTGRRGDEPEWYHAKGSKVNSISTPLQAKEGTTQ